MACWSFGVPGRTRISALKIELQLVKATLELADGREIGVQAMEELLRKLLESADDAMDLLG